MGSLVAIIANDSFYILHFDCDAYNSRLDQGAELTDDGVEEAFDVWFLQHFDNISGWPCRVVKMGWDKYRYIV